MSTLRDRLAQSHQNVNLTVLSKPEQSYNLIAALWQESALERITPSLRNTPAHKAIGALVAKLHTNAINAGRAEQIFLNLLSLEGTN